MNRENTEWTTGEIRQLRELIDKGKRLPQIAQELGRTQTGVRVKAQKLGWSVWRASAFESANVRCPFFADDRDKMPGGTIKCEGVLRGAGATVSIFSELEDWETQVRRFCQKNWEGCPIARILEKKYNDEA